VEKAGKKRDPRKREGGAFYCSIISVLHPFHEGEGKKEGLRNKVFSHECCSPNGGGTLEKGERGKRDDRLSSLSLKLLRPKKREKEEVKKKENAAFDTLP